MARKIVSVLLTVCMIALLAGCGSNPAPAAADNAPAEEKKEVAAATEEVKAAEEVAEEVAAEDITADLTLWSYPRFDDQDEFFTEDVMAAFNEKYPNITLNMTTIPWDGGPEKVNVAIASGTAPDLLTDTDMRINGYATKGVLVPLDDVIEANAEGVSEVWQNDVVVDGKKYLAPTYTSGCASMAVNVALAEKYGIADMLPEDHMSWSWDDFAKFCRAGTEAGKADGVYGIGFFAGSQSSDSNTLSWLMGGGDTVMNEDCTKIAINTDNAAKVLDNMAELVEDGTALPGATTIIDDEIIELFLGGKLIAMQYCDLWTINEAYSRAEAGEIDCPMDAQYYLMPSLDGNPSRSICYGASGWCVFDNGDEDKIAAAKAFIDFFMGSEWEEQYLNKAAQLPCKSGYTVAADKPAVSKQIDIMNTMAARSVTNWGSQLGCWTEVRSVFYPEIQAVYSGVQSGKDALTNFANNAQKIIDENQ